MKTPNGTTAGPQVEDGLPKPRRRVAYAALALATTMAVLDGSIANTALPRIARDLHVSATASIWVVNAFQVVVTMSLLPFAALGQTRGTARVYRIGVIAFVIGSLLCALARSLPLLIAARVAQGLGASAIMAIAPALLREVFPNAQLGRALGINALVVATSSAAGPTIGGIVLAFLPWPWLFAINVPLGLANVFLNRALPDPRGSGARLDVPSVAASGAGFALVIWGLDGVARAEPVWSIAARLAAGIGALAWFARRQFTLARPMIALDLFKIRPFALAASTSLGSFTAQGLAYVALPFYFQEGLGRTPLDSALLLTPWPVAVALIAPFAGRLSDRYPAGILSTAGLAVLALGLALYARLPPHASVAAIVLHGIICGLGFGFFQSPNNRELMGSAPREKTSSAAGLLATIRVSGQTLGASAVGIIFGSFGASLASAGTVGADILAATPAALWLACGAATLAMLSSAWRLRPVSAAHLKREGA